ncbi:hypothetical protein EZS27_013064 [termite gut metagenome]|uniref:Uncharacterized protein n=1 Tax=termite gut metagenome TaxID=433724 RepID=A0A5J4RYR9_9ZZZZ
MGKDTIVLNNKNTNRYNIYYLSSNTKMNLPQEQNHLAKGYDEVKNIASALGSLLPLDSQGDYDEGQAEYLRLHKKKKKKRGISR